MTLSSEGKSSNLVMYNSNGNLRGFYFFSRQQVKLDNGRYLPFNYSINPEMNELTVDGMKFNMEFGPEKIYLKSKTNQMYNTYIKFDKLDLSP